MLRLILAALHLIALGLGLGAVLSRGTALREPLAHGALKRAFRADAMWGIAAVLWLGTGLWRYMGATEKATGYYNANHLFLTKLGLFLLIVGLEIWPMMTLIRWRRAMAKGKAPESVVDSRAARRIATISHVQATLIALMVFLAVAVARGFGGTG